MRGKGRNGRHAHRVLALNQKITGPIVGMVRGEAVAGCASASVECLSSALAMAGDQWLGVVVGRRWTKLQ